MKKSRPILISIVILLIINLISANLTGCSPERKPVPKKSINDSTTSFLSANRQAISFIARSNNPYNILDNNLKNKQVFFLGEIHGIENNEKIDFELLKYLQKKVGIKYYLGEMGYSSAYFINQYLTTGNEKYLNSLFDEFAGTVGWTKEGYNFWQSLYEYNKQLPNDKKIKVVGIDLEHQYKLGIIHMNDILPKKPIPQSVNSIINKLKSINRDRNFEPKIINGFLQRLKKDMNEKPLVYKRYLGNSFFDFQQISQNIINDFEFSKIEGDWYKSSNLRDKLIFENFSKILSQVPKGSKFYGMWGRPHALQRESDKINYVAALMNKKDSKVRNKVLSIAIYYKDCYRLAVNNNGNYEKEAFSDENTITTPLVKGSKTNIDIFRLTGKNSPFNKGLKLIEFPTRDGRTVDYFQYVILIKNAGPSSALR